MNKKRKFSKDFIRMIVKEELINVLKEQTDWDMGGFNPRMPRLDLDTDSWERFGDPDYDPPPKNTGAAGRTGTRTAAMPQGPFTKGGTPPLGDPTATRVTGPPVGPEGTRMTGPPRGMTGPEGTRVTGPPRMFGPEGTAVDLKPRGMQGGTRVGGRAVQKTAVKKAAEAVGKTGLKRIGATLATRAGIAAAGSAATGPAAPVVGTAAAIGLAALTVIDLGILGYQMFSDDDSNSKEDRTQKALQHLENLPQEKVQQIVSQGMKYAPGPCKKNKTLGKKLRKAMQDSAKKAGVKSWSQLPFNHPARIDYRAWYKCRPIPSQQNTQQEKKIAMQDLVDDPSLV